MYIKLINIIWILLIFLFHLRLTLYMCDYNTTFFTVGILVILIVVSLFFSFKKRFFAILPLLILIPYNESSIILIFIFLLTYLSNSIELKFIGKYNAIISIVFLVLNYFLLSFGIINETHLDLSYKGSNIVSDFGYGNPNTFSIFVFTILLSIYLIKERHSYTYWFVYLITSYIIYYLSGSRTIFYTELFFMLISALQGCKLGKLLYNRIILYLVPIIIIAFITYSIILTITNPIIDYFFSFRFSRSYSIISSMDLIDILIGHPMNEEFMIDIAYCSLFFSGGIISIYYFLFLYFKFINKVNMNSYLIPIVLSFLVLGICEAVMVGTYLIGGLLIWFILYSTVYGTTEKEKRYTAINCNSGL